MVIPSRKYAPFIVLLSLLLLALGIFIGFQIKEGNAIARINSFDDCAAAGYPIMESYPPRCMTPDGRSFTDEEISTPTEPEEVFCTMDSKVCPDGSAVGRVSPTCEFAPCPGE